MGKEVRENTNQSQYMNEILFFIAGMSSTLAGLFIYEFFTGRKVVGEQKVVIKVEVDSKQALVSLKEIEDAAVRINEKVKISEKE